MDASRLAHGNSAPEIVVILNVSMAFSTNRIGHSVGLKFAVPLFGGTLRLAPNMIYRFVFAKRTQVVDRVIRCNPVFRGMCRFGWGEDRKAWRRPYNEYPFAALRDTIIGGVIEVQVY